ncbi:MAG: carboxypeptidase-like regulatory domain-containing protein [Patescibacteria group bacterium]|nr:carboxypeptidase-like regulatory domain-containing protein [Patescibacteria group bacterium]
MHPTDPTCVADYCTQHPTAPQCTAAYCTLHPTDPLCQSPVCQTNPSDPACSFCSLYPTDPSCQSPACQANPAAPECQLCYLKPTDPACTLTYCQQNPTAMLCVCRDNPTAPACLSFCQANPTDPSCAGHYCEQNPTDPACQSPLCQQNPNAPECQYCALHPENPVCQQQFCSAHPDDAACQQAFCKAHPLDPSCATKTIKDTTKEVYSFLSNTLVQDKNSSQVAAGIGAVAIAPAAVVLQYSLATQGLILNIGSLADLWLLFLQLFNAFLTAIGIRAKRRYWGTVYDASSKQPLDPVIVELVDAKTGKVVEQNITDMHGRFGFLDRPGTYSLKASKTHYRFPSQLVVGRVDGIFDNLYHGEEISVQKAGDTITPNVPMDPLDFDWNQMDKKRVVNTHPRLEYLVHMVLEVMFWAGALLVVFNAIVHTTIYSIVFLIVYLLLAIMREIIPHERLWGRVVTSRPEGVKDLILELTPVAFPTVIMGRAVVAPTGKFFLKTMPGKYLLSVKAFDGTIAKVIKQQDVIVGKDGVVNDVIRV